MTSGPIPGFRRHVATALVVVAFGASWLAVLLATGGGIPWFQDGYRVRVIVPTAASLAPNARVTMAGVDVGRVGAVERRGLAAVVELEIDDDRVTPIAADSRVQIRQRTPIGENYVAIEPGRSRRTLASGATVAASEAEDYVDVDQVLSMLQGDTRARAREFIQGFGGALAGRGDDLNALLDGTARTLQAGGRVANVLSRDREHVSRLVQQFGDVSRVVGDRGVAMRQFARHGFTTFRAIAERDDSLRAFVDELPATLRQLRSTTATLDEVTGTAAPVVTNLATATLELRPAVELLGPATAEGRGVLRELGMAAPQLERTLGRLQQLSRPTVAAMPRVSSTLCELNPTLRYLKPYARDMVATAIGLGAGMKTYDAVGHLMRVTPVVTEQAVAGLPPQVHQAAETLIESGLLQETRTLGYEPYPLPNSVGTNPRGRGVLGPAEVEAEFPRVEADC